MSFLSPVVACLLKHGLNKGGGAGGGVTGSPGPPGYAPVRNEKLEKLRLTFSRYPHRDVARLREYLEVHVRAVFN